MQKIKEKVESIQYLLSEISTVTDENNKEIEYRLSKLESNNIILADAFENIAKIFRGSYDGKNI